MAFDLIDTTSSLSEVLLPSLNFHNRPEIRLPRRKHKIQPRDDQRDDKDRRCPVETCGRHWGRLRPEAPEESPGAVCDGCDVDGDAPVSEGELGRWEGFGVSYSAPEDL